MGEIENRKNDRLLLLECFLILPFLNFNLALINVVDFGISMGFAVNARTDGHIQTDKQYTYILF